MPETDELAVEVVYALRDRQIAIRLRVPRGTTIAQAIERSAIARALPDVDIGHAPVGIFGRIVSCDTPLCEGDRIEIYRPLVVDAKQARRERAARQ